MPTDRFAAQESAGESSILTATALILTAFAAVLRGASTEWVESSYSESLSVTAAAKHCFQLFRY